MGRSPAVLVLIVCQCVSVCVCVSSVAFRLVKPDIVFFGENLPESFFQRSKTDMPQ